jgi:hypothetical protein
MAISHGADTRTALANTAVDLLDAGAGAGLLKFLNSVDTVLCTITLADPAFGAASGPTALLASVPRTGTVGVSGTITKFWMTDSNSLAATTIAGTVGTSGADINLSSVTVSVNDVIQIDSLAYTAAT